MTCRRLLCDIQRVTQNLRLAMRMLRANASLVTAAVMTLALGIGATTVMFSVTYGVLMRPLPYDESDRLVQLSERTAEPGLNRIPNITNITYFAWDGHSHTISSIATYSSRMFTVGLDNPVRMLGNLIHSVDVRCAARDSGARRFGAKAMNLA
jgi:putative ABC transport system permease protein